MKLNMHQTQSTLSLLSNFEITDVEQYTSRATGFDTRMGDTKVYKV